jgi:hypothetical protein
MLLTGVFAVLSVFIAVGFLVKGQGVGMFFSLLLLTLIASAIVFVALSRTTSLGWSLIAVFLATGLYAVGLQGLRTYHRPKIEAVALILKKVGAKTQSPIKGAFVTESDSQIYVAVHTTAGAWVIRTIPRSTVVEERIGQVARTKDVLAAATKLAQLTGP